MEADNFALVISTQYAELTSTTARYFYDLYDILAKSSSKLPSKRAASPEPAKKPTQKERREKKEKKEKKWSKTGYYLYTEHKKAELRQVPEYEKLKMTEMSSLIAQKWNNLKEAEQDVWKQRATQLKIETEEQTASNRESEEISGSDARKRQKVN
jgi:hypothetical protein